MSEVRQLVQQIGSEVETNDGRTDTTDRNLTRPMRLPDLANNVSQLWLRP